MTSYKITHKIVVQSDDYEKFVRLCDALGEGGYKCKKIDTKVSKRNLKTKPTREKTTWKGVYTKEEWSKRIEEGE